MLVAQAVIGAQPPALQVREDPVDPLEGDVGGQLVADAQVPRDVRPARNAEIGAVRVGVDCAARRRVRLDERPDMAAGVLGNALQPDPARAAAASLLDGADDEYLADGALALAARRRLLRPPERDARLVDLDVALERRPVGRDHGPAQLVQEQPGRLVGANADLRLELKGRDPVRVRRDEIGGDEPSPQRQVRAVHDRAGNDGGLLAATGGVALPGALPDPRLRLEAPPLLRAAVRADEAIRPAALGQMLGAGVVVGEVRHEPLKRRRLVVLPARGEQGFGHDVA